MKDAEKIARERKRVEDMADFAIKNAQKHYRGLASDKDAAILFSVRAAMWSLYCMTKREEYSAGYAAAREQAAGVILTKCHDDMLRDEEAAAIRAMEPHNE